MTPDQLPAGLPMDDKIEAWVQRANDIAAHIAELQARLVMYDTQTLHTLHNAWKEQKAKLAASQESGTLRKVIDIAIKEQNKC